MKKITCKGCGICCLQPPQIETEEELVFAIGQGVDIRRVNINEFTKSGDGGEDSSDKAIYFILRQDGKCPFLNEHYGCDIYENRFSTCRRFECENLDKDIEDISILGFTQPSPSSLDGVNQKRNIELPKTIGDKYGIESVPLVDAIKLIGGVTLQELTQHISRVTKN